MGRPDRFLTKSVNPASEFACPLASGAPIAHDCSIDQALETEAKMQAPDAAAGGQKPQDTILVVEDDPDIVEILRLYLESSGYRFLSAGDGKRGLDVLHGGDASLVLVDLMMPSMNGFDFIKEARAFTDIPIIIVSARNQPSDKVLGLDLGADGYVTKPFDPTEVLAYVRSALRRYNQSKAAPHDGEGPATGEKNVLSAGDLELDLDTLVLRKRGNVMPLTASELKILHKMMSAPGHVFTKAQLYEAISGSSYGGAESIMMHVSNIRSKIEDDPGKPAHIKTVRGLGYRFDE